MMIDRYKYLLGVLACLLLTLPAMGLPLNSTGEVKVCPVDGQLIRAENVPGFSESVCLTQNIDQLDPQGQLLWVGVELDLSQEQLSEVEPVGLFISGKTSAKVWLNGRYLGQNGEPGLTAEQEQPGRIDAVIHMPSDAFKPGPNQLQLLLSAHHGWIQLAHPIHRISIGTYQHPVNGILRYYWPSLLPFGVLLLGFFYLALLARLTHLPKHVMLLPLMALLAASQLFIEVIRGLYSYPYPMHDLRLVLILLCAAGFGFSLLAYVMGLIPLSKRWLHWLISVVVILLIITLVPGFDSKNLLAIMLAALIAVSYLMKAWWSGQRQVPLVVALITGLMLMTFLTAYRFIDTFYYYYVALLIFVLMAYQAKQASDDKKLQMKYHARAKQLLQILEQKSLPESNDKLEIRSAGKTEWVLIKNLAYCKGAGDYVELVDTDGEVKLYHGSLTELSLRLPSTFLKTHRSYLVNTTLITALERSASGAGHLLLAQGDQVPVSKRIMPQVKQQLG